MALLITRQQQERYRARTPRIPTAPRLPPRLAPPPVDVAGQEEQGLLSAGIRPSRPIQGPTSRYRGSAFELPGAGERAPGTYESRLRSATAAPRARYDPLAEAIGRASTGEYAAGLGLGALEATGLPAAGRRLAPFERYLPGRLPRTQTERPIGRAGTPLRTLTEENALAANIGLDIAGRAAVLGGQFALASPLDYRDTFLPRPLEVLAREATRPANYLGAAFPRLAFRAGAGVFGRVAPDIIASAAGQEAFERTEGLPGPVRFAGALAAGGVAGSAAVRAPGTLARGARTFALAEDEGALRRAAPRAFEYGRGVPLPGETPWDESFFRGRIGEDVIPRRTIVGPRGVTTPGAAGGASRVEAAELRAAREWRVRVDREGLTPELQAEAMDLFSRTVSRLSAEDVARAGIGERRAGAAFVDELAETRAPETPMPAPTAESRRARTLRQRARSRADRGLPPEPGYTPEQLAEYNRIAEARGMTRTSDVSRETPPPREAFDEPGPQGAAPSPEAQAASQRRSAESRAKREQAQRRRFPLQGGPGAEGGAPAPPPASAPTIAIERGWPPLAPAAPERPGIGTDRDTGAPDIVAARADQLSQPGTVLIPDDAPFAGVPGVSTRGELRRRIGDLLYGTGSPTKDRRADIVLGLPASGKSGIVVRKVAAEHGGLVIDSDDAKELLPEFQGGKYAGAVHKESSDIADAVMARGVGAGDNMVLPLVGKNPDRIRDAVGLLSAHGYEVHLHYVDLDPAEAAMRAVTRYQETGRFVDPDYVLKVGKSPEMTYNAIKSDPRVASYEAYSNDVPFGSQPVLLERGGGAGRLPGAPAGGSPAGAPTTVGTVQQAEAATASLDIEPSLTGTTGPRLPSSAAPQAGQAAPAAATGRQPRLVDAAPTGPVGPPREPPPAPPGGGGMQPPIPGGPGAPKVPNDPFVQRAVNFVTDLLNVPRSVVSSGDLSASARQSLFMAPRHHREWASAFKAQAQSLASEANAQRVFDDIQTAPMARYRRDTSLHIQHWNEAKVGKREEQFASKYAGKLPVVAQTQRAYVMMLNKFRADSFDSIVQTWPETARTPQRIEKLARYINAATGRGRIPEGAQGWASVLNATFFSPRFMLSIPQRHLAALTTDPYIRNEVLKDIGAFYGSGLTLVGLAYMGSKAGILPVDVEVDRRSSDFGKIRVGNTRIDPWGGHQQFAVLLGRIASGDLINGQAQVKSTASGEVYNKDVLDVVGQWLKYKLSPVARTAEQLRTGKDVFGDPAEMDLRHALLRSDKELGWATQLLTPLFAQSIYEAFREGGTKAALITAPLSFFGVGVNTYAPEQLDVAAREVTGARTFSQLPPGERQRMLAQNPEAAKQYEQEALGRGGAGGRLTEVRVYYRQQQEASDQRLAKGELNRPQWRDQFDNRQVEVRGALAGIFGPGSKPEDRRILYQGNITDASQTPLGRYYAQLDGARRADGSIDFDKVEAWRGTLSEQENRYIDDNTGLGTTARAREYLGLKRQVRDAGLYQLRDDLWSYYQEVAPELAGYRSYYDYRDALQRDYEAAAAERGYSPGVAAKLAADAVGRDKVVKKYTSVKNKEETNWIGEHPELADKAAEWGIITLTKREAKGLAGALR